MKIEKCTKSYETLCDNPKFCCDRLKIMTEGRIFFVDVYGVTLYNNQPNYNAEIPPLVRIPIHYCPFCGEKVEDK
jgi:hypothetical protein